MTGYIYVLKDKLGVPFYVGATDSPYSRLGAHVSLIKMVGKTYTPPVYRYMKKNKIKPTMDILETISYRNRETLLKAEGKWIRKFQRRGFEMANVCSANKYKCQKALVWIDLELLEEVKIVSARLGVSVSEYVNAAIKEANARYSKTIES